MTAGTRAAGACLGLPDQRVSWALAPHADVAACVTVGSGGLPSLEVRTPAGVSTHEMPGLSPMSQLVVRDDATVFACHHYRARHVVTRTAAGDTCTLLDTGGRALWLLPAAAGQDPLAVEPGDDRSRLLTLAGECLAELPGTAVRGVWLGERRLAVTVRARRGSRAVELDLTSGTVTPLLSVAPHTHDAVVGAAAGLVVVATDAAGPVRLGFGRLEGLPVRFPAELAAETSVEFLACSPDGALIALDAPRGAVSRIRFVDTHTLAVREVDPGLPLAALGRGRLTSRELVVPVSLPDRPGTLLRQDVSRGRSSFDDPAVDGAPPVGVTTVAGIECVVLGDPAAAGTTVLALHGGPVEAWTAAYDPLLAGLAGTGAAVVAPNVRGSAGYGPAHAAAIRDRWGGPDLADVLAVAEAITSRRPPSARPPVLVGSSYGAWLALLAAQAAPEAFTAVAALCPFVSGRRVLDAGGPVAALVTELGGAGSPDLRDGAGLVRCPVLIVHGRHDDVVPLAEARLLHAALTAAGVPARLHVAEAGHDLLHSPDRDGLVARIAGFAHDPGGR